VRPKPKTMRLRPRTGPESVRQRTRPKPRNSCEAKAKNHEAVKSVCKKRCVQEFGYFVDVVYFTVTSAGLRQLYLRKKGSVVKKGRKPLG